MFLCFHVDMATTEKLTEKSFEGREVCENVKRYENSPIGNITQNGAIICSASCDGKIKDEPDRHDRRLTFP